MPAVSYYKFFPSDWSGDEDLRSTSLNARGLWKEMTNIMNVVEEKGYLVIGGRGITEADVEVMARQFSAHTNEVRKGLAELQRAGVYSTTAEGVIYCRGIVRRAEREIRAREAGLKGGSPTLKHSTEHTPTKMLDKMVKHSDKPHGRETRNQIPDIDSLRSSFAEAEPDVRTFLDNAAAANKTGKISIGREVSLRRDLRDVLTERLAGSVPALIYGLRAANSKEPPAVNSGYVRSAGCTFLERGEPASAQSRPRKTIHGWLRDGTPVEVDANDTGSWPSGFSTISPEERE